jgi:hypothetical protein
VFLDVLEINIEIYDPFHIRISIIWFLKWLVVLKICSTSFTMSLKINFFKLSTMKINFLNFLVFLYF